MTGQSRVTSGTVALSRSVEPLCPGTVLSLLGVACVCVCVGGGGGGGLQSWPLVRWLVLNG